MKSVWTFGLGAALALASTAALAFDEQKPVATAPAPSAPLASGGTSAPRLDLGSGADTSSSRSGTVITLPGFGKIGELPKMDLGLELLYGANDSKSPIPQSGPESDGVTIRGAIKHTW